MGKYLKLGGDPSGERWSLPEQTDVDKVRALLSDAMEDKKAVRVAVVVGRNQTAELIVNGRAVTSALVWEDAPAGGGMTIID